MWSLLVDVAILAFILFGLWRGYREGVFAASANLIGLILSLLIAFWLYQPLADWLLSIWSIPIGLMRIFAFLFIAFVMDGAITALVLVGSNRFGSHTLQSPLAHQLGTIPGGINALLTISYLIAIVTSLPIEHPIKTSVTGSTLAKPLIGLVEQTGLPVSELVTPALSDLSQLFTVEPGSDEMVDLGFSVANPQVAASAEEAMLELVNKERIKVGIRPVVMDDSLRELARAHSFDMYQRGYFSHYTPEGKDPFDRMEEHNITYLAAGENLALAPTVDMAHTGLMNSPGHRKNILDPKYHKIGIGAYQDPRYGIMFSQEFTN